MSAIQKELLKAAGLEAEDFKSRRDLHEAIVKAVNKLSDDEWNDLTAKAQDWFNDAADAVKAKKAPAEFPDYKEPTAEPETRSRRRSDPEQTQTAAAGEESGAEDLEEGQRVKITYKKRGSEKVADGEVVEVSKRKGFVVVKEGDDEHEIDFDAVVRVEVFHGTAAEPEPETSAGPAVGDEVKFQNKRGKKFQGVVKALTDEYIELDDGSDCDLEKIDGDVEIVKKAKPASDTARSSRRGSDEPKDDKAGKGKDDEPEKVPRSSNPKGVSVGGRIRELLAEDPEMSMEDVGKALKKADIEFRDTTLKMIFGDCTDFLGKLKAAGNLKKGK